MFPNVLLCPHVCKTSLNEVCVSSLYRDIATYRYHHTFGVLQQISDLTVGKAVAVETKRKNQIAFLIRLSDENGIPKVQVQLILYVVACIAVILNYVYIALYIHFLIPLSMCMHIHAYIFMSLKNSECM